MGTTKNPSRPAIQPAAFKLPEACQYLGGISKATVRRLVKRGLLRPNRHLRYLVFSKAELDRFVTEEAQ